MYEEVIKQIQTVADETNFLLGLERSDDGMYIDCQLNQGAISIDVAVPKHNGQYYAYSIESPGLPREVYSDEIAKDFSESRRSEEIVQTLNGLLSRTIMFHKKPTLFSRTSGYIEIPLDGDITKIPVKNNYFNLPVKD